MKLKIIKMCFVYIALNSTMTCYSFFVYNNAHEVEYVHITLIWYQYTKISNRRVAMYNYVIDSFFIQWKSVKFTHSKNLRAISHSDMTFYFVFPQQVLSYGSEETILALKESWYPYMFFTGIKPPYTLLSKATWVHC